jgi:LysR family transcriptional regulator, glycine cleavage system transcriptional activator
MSGVVLPPAAQEERMTIGPHSRRARAGAGHDMPTAAEATPPVRRVLPPLNAVRAFDAAAATGNFSEAGRQLNVSQGAISRHVAQLEAYLGATLFERVGRRVHLTEEGAEYARAVRTGLDRIQEATRLHMELRRLRPLRLRLFPTVAMKWLVPRLGRFHALYPDIDLQITTTANQVSLDADDVDFTIQTMHEPRDNVIYQQLLEIVIVPVCSPAYLRAMTAPVDARALLHGVLLHSMKRPGDWRTWFHAAQVAPDSLHEGLKFGNSSLAYQAAIDGVGIAIAHTAFVRDDLGAGRLVVCHPLMVRTGQHYYLASRQDRDSRAAALFRSWIATEVQADARAEEAAAARVVGPG